MSSGNRVEFFYKVSVVRVEQVIFEDQGDCASLPVKEIELFTQLVNELSLHEVIKAVNGLK
jgi:hypothetical protein